ncbi:helix-turn-helix domain-containing protein [Haladaptatus sp. CMAA 1911]|uniref:helix-turn-helix domain-containing protein n=1 Tax=unclassified Haladaptatus TaxID=2622732 RepID=UPI003754B716
MGGTLVEIQLEAGDFALAHSFQALPDTTFEIKPVVIADDRPRTAFLWVGSPNREQVNRAFAADESVTGFQFILASQTELLYHLDWDSRIEPLVHRIVEKQGTVLTAVGENGQWTFRIFFAEHNDISDYFAECENSGLSLEITSLKEFPEPHQRPVGLTDGQHETLRRAYLQGYYAIPRTTTADELATEFGVSHQAISERLRRGHRQLVEQMLIAGRETPEL